MNIDIDKARQNLHLRAEKEKQRNLELHRRAKDDAGRIINMIIERFQPVRIYQWGSVLNPEKFNRMSDIDIAVEGVTAAEDIFALWGEAEKLTRFSLDIVQLEKIEPEFAALIKEKGTLVYEQK